MEDHQLIELIRRGMSAWQGASPRAPAALYARHRQWTRWRYVATFSAAAAALLAITATLAGGPVPALHDMGISTIGSFELQPSPSPATTPQSDHTSAPAAVPPVVRKAEPAPVRSAPTAAPTQPTDHHEPVASPTPTPAPPTQK